MEEDHYKDTKEKELGKKEKQDLIDEKRHKEWEQILKRDRNENQKTVGGETEIASLA